MKLKSSIIFFSLCCALFLFSAETMSQEKEASGLPAEKPVLVRAVTCEGIKTHDPWNPAAVFSISTGNAFCFTSFDPVPQKTFIYHKWFHRDKLNAKIKLTLSPPRWATFSRIHLRESDKGPWRVEITDPEGNISDVLRFSITD